MMACVLDYSLKPYWPQPWDQFFPVKFLKSISIVYLYIWYIQCLYIYMYIYKISKFRIHCIYTYIQTIFMFHIQRICTVYIAVYKGKYIYTFFGIYDIYKKVYISYIHIDTQGWLTFKIYWKRDNGRTETLRVEHTYSNLNFKSTYSSRRGLIPNIDGIYMSRWFCLRYKTTIFRPRENDSIFFFILFFEM